MFDEEDKPMTEYKLSAQGKALEAKRKIGMEGLEGCVGGITQDGLNFLKSLKNDLVKKTIKRRWTESQSADGKDQGRENSDRDGKPLGCRGKHSP
jgi:hypothetical protein